MRACFSDVLYAALLAGILAGGLAIVVRGAGPLTENAQPPYASADHPAPATEEDQEQQSYRRGARSLPSNADRGRQQFLRVDLACVSCHDKPGSGGDIGPDLICVGRNRDREYLITCILRPSANLVPGYGTVSLSIEDGGDVTGSYLGENDSTIEVKIGGASHKVPKARIRARHNASPMPDGLYKLLTPQEFADLLAYLESLRGVPVKN